MKTKKMIILQGKSKVGKTTTLNRVIESLTSEQGFDIKVELSGGFDRRVVLQRDDGFKIAICTSGDSADIIVENYRFFIEQDCNVIISACNVNPETLGSRTNLMKMGLIAFASGYFKSREVHFNEDSDYVRLFTLNSQSDEEELMRAIIEEVFRYI